MADYKTLASWTAKSGLPVGTSNVATRDVRNYVLVLDFDDTTDEEIGFDGFMPLFYDPNDTARLRIGWMASHPTPSAQEVSWEIAFMRIRPSTQDLDDQTWDDPVFSTSNIEASASGEIAEAFCEMLDNTYMDGIVAGEWFRLKVNRNADGSSGQMDSLTGDAQLVYIALEQVIG